jgi:hypothetical protein
LGRWAFWFEDDLNLVNDKKNACTNTKDDERWWGNNKNIRMLTRNNEIATSN